MKKSVKQQSYNKMYLITPMVYEKIKQHLDKSDLMSLNNINKPFFNPTIEIHGSTNQFPQPPPPPPPPEINLPGNNDMPLLDESYDDFLRSMDMDWQEFENFPPVISTREMTTQTDPVAIPATMSTQTDPFVVPKVEQQTQTTAPQPATTSVQTDPIVVQKTDQQTQTMKKRPDLQFSGVTQTSYTPERPPLQFTPVQQHSYIPEPQIKIERQSPPPPPPPSPKKKKKPQLQQTPVEHHSILPELQIKVERKSPPPVQRKKIMPTKTSFTQTTPPGTPKKARKRKNPTKIVGPTIQQPRLNIPREIPAPIQSRELVVAGPRMLQPVQRQPSGIVLTPELQQYLLHQRHYGQPVFPARPPNFPRRPLAAITQQEYPLLPAQTRELDIPESTYFVETPADEPPGQRDVSNEEIVLPHRVLTKTFKSKKPKKFTPTHIINRPPEEDSELYQRINLPPSKKMWPCDVCGAMLSSKYNLERHQIRERKKLEESGRLPTTDLPLEEGMQQFQTWVQLPAKRTATDAKLKSDTYRKRVTKEPQTSLTFKQWENPEKD
jgi:hypothetical protein